MRVQPSIDIKGLKNILENLELLPKSYEALKTFFAYFYKSG